MLGQAKDFCTWQVILIPPAEGLTVQSDCKDSSCQLARGLTDSGWQEIRILTIIAEPPS